MSSNNSNEEDYHNNEGWYTLAPRRNFRPQQQQQPPNVVTSIRNRDPFQDLFDEDEENELVREEDEYEPRTPAISYNDQ